MIVFIVNNIKVNCLPDKSFELISGFNKIVLDKETTTKLVKELLIELKEE